MTSRTKPSALLVNVQVPLMGGLISVLGFAVMLGGVYMQAFATSRTPTTTCLNESSAGSYVTSFTRGAGTVATKNGAPLCHATTLVLESFAMPAAWNGQGFNDSALPQTKYASVEVSLPAGQANVTKTAMVDTPAACKNTQLDFYFPPAYDGITTLTGDDARYIGGEIFGGSGACTTPTPVPSVTPLPTPTPVAASMACTNLQASATSGPAPLTVNFTGSGAATGQTISQYQFDFGDNDAISTSSSTASHTYAQAGTYYAKLLVKGSTGAVSPEVTACRIKLAVAGVTPTPKPTSTPAVAGAATSVLPQTGVAGPLMTMIGALVLTAGIVHIWLTQRHKLIVVPDR